MIELVINVHTVADALWIKVNLLSESSYCQKEKNEVE